MEEGAKGPSDTSQEKETMISIAGGGAAQRWFLRYNAWPRLEVATADLILEHRTVMNGYEMV